MKIRVVKESTFFPVVGEVHDVQPSPRVRVLMHKGYIVKADGPVAEPAVVEIPAETVVVDTTAEAQAAFEDIEDDAPGEDIDEDDLDDEDEPEDPEDEDDEDN